MAVVKAKTTTKKAKPTTKQEFTAQANLINKLPVETIQRRTRLLKLLLWAMPAMGKTQLAGTAPRPSLWLQHDPEGTDTLAPIAAQDDSAFQVVDMTQMAPRDVKRVTSDDPFGLETYLKAHPEIATIICDSITSFGELALAYGVIDAAATVRRGIPPTLEEPGMSGYGRKNTWVSTYVRKLQRIATRYKKHLIVIGHEKDVYHRSPITKQEELDHHTISIGSGLVNSLAMLFNEIWHLHVRGGNYTIRLTPTNFYRPVRTKMFDTRTKRSVVWRYDPMTDTGTGIDQWITDWQKQKGAKLDPARY